jgi:membrane protein DedA with SNARE-associated domain
LLLGLISSYIEHFTYLGLFVILMLCGWGLPMPEDVPLLVGGFLAHKGVTRYPITLIVALLGVIAGDNSLYFIGRGVGSNLLSYFRLKRAGPKSQLDRMHAFMHRHGHLAIFYARFFPGFRALVYLCPRGHSGSRPAGSSSMTSRALRFRCRWWSHSDTYSASSWSRSSRLSVSSIS